MDEEARCGTLCEAVKLLLCAKRGAQRAPGNIALPSTREPGKLEALLEELLEHPAERLAVYGTLAPGEENHHVIAVIRGTWEKGWVPGVLGRIGPYPAFRWRPSGTPILVQVLSSPRLPSHWASLDRFEGASYRRILAPVTISAEKVQVANIYEGVEFT